MISAWLFFYDPKVPGYKFEERHGASFQDTNPESWGLHKGCMIMLVLQKAQFLGAWVFGDEVKKT